MTVSLSGGIIQVDADTAFDSGSTTGGSSTTLQDSGASFDSSYVGRVLQCVDEFAIILEASTTQLTFFPAMVNAPVSGTDYWVHHNFEDLYDADVAGTWGLVTKLDDETYRITAEFRNRGFFGDFGKTLVNINSNIYVSFGTGSSFCFGLWDATTEQSSFGCTFIAKGLTGTKQCAVISNQGVNFGQFSGCNFIARDAVTAGNTHGFIMQSTGLSVNGRINLRNNTVQRAATNGIGIVCQARLNLSAGQDPDKLILDGLNVVDADFLPQGFVGYESKNVSTSRRLILTTFASGEVFRFPQIRHLQVPPTVLPRSNTSYDLNPVFPPGYERPAINNNNITVDGVSIVAYNYKLQSVADAKLGIYTQQGDQVFYETANGSGAFDTLEIIRDQSTGGATTYTTYTPHDFYLARYGYYPLDWQISFNVADHGGRELNVGNRVPLTYPFLVADEITASAITGVAITHSPPRIEISAPRTLQEIHDWLHYVKTLSANINRPVGMLASSINRIACSDYEILLSGSGDIDFLGKRLDFSGIFTTVATVDYSEYAIDFSDSAKLVVVDNQDWISATFEDGTVVEVANGADVTITVASSDLAAQLDGNKLETSGSITFVAPAITLTAPNLPDGTHYLLRYADGAAEELDIGYVSGGLGLSVALPAQDDRLIRLLAIHVSSSPLYSSRLFSFTFRNSGNAVSTEESLEEYPIYADFGIDGLASEITSKFTFDNPNLQVDATEVDGLLSAQEVHAFGWGQMQLNHDALRLGYVPFEAFTQVGYIVRSGWQVENQSLTTPLLITDGYYVAESGNPYNPCAPATGGKQSTSVFFETSHTVTIEGGGGSGLGPEDIARLESIENQLKADYWKGEDRFQRYLPGTSTVILDKDVSLEPDGFHVTEHVE